MRKDYKCVICHESIKKNKRLVYQEFDGRQPYGAFHNKRNYDFCDKCFRMFKSWIQKHKIEKEK